MNPDLLKRFCAHPDEPRTWLHTPLRHNGRLYATNGHILINIADDPAITARSDDPAAIQAITRFERDIAQAAGYAPLAILQPIPAAETCKPCKGSGRVTTCDECGGTGSFQHGSYTYDCAKCSGNGEFGVSDGITCHNCHGSGETFGQAIRFGAATFARRYLALLLELPNVELATNTYQPECATAYYRFDGGWGVLMPYYKRS